MEKFPVRLKDTVQMSLSGIATPSPVPLKARKSLNGKPPKARRVPSPRRSGTGADAGPRIWTYIVDHDLGFAPNPFYLVCTLGACKPKIRRYAKLGDIVIGTGSKPSGNQGRLIYWMRVDDILTFDQYWKDPRFQRKKPVMRGSLMQRYGDNIYHRKKGQTEFTQEDSFHSQQGGVPNEENLETDTGSTDRVLIGRDYAYWGGEGPLVPKSLAEFVHSTQGEKCRFPRERVNTFLDWLKDVPGRGFVADPTDWPK